MLAISHLSRVAHFLDVVYVKCSRMIRSESTLTSTPHLYTSPIYLHVHINSGCVQYPVTLLFYVTTSLIYNIIMTKTSLKNVFIY